MLISTLLVRGATLAVAAVGVGLVPLAVRIARRRRWLSPPAGALPAWISLFAGVAMGCLTEAASIALPPADSRISLSYGIVHDRFLFSQLVEPMVAILVFGSPFALGLGLLPGRDLARLSAAEGVDRPPPGGMMSGR